MTYRFGELDIVAQEGDVLVFVEVKSRKNDGYGAAEYAVSQVKQQRLWKAAEAYLGQQKHMASPLVRFDVVAETNGDMRWIRDAFRIGL